MKELDTELIQLRDQTWRIARKSLENKETRIYRSLTDIAEKLTSLIGTTDKSSIDTNQKAEMLPIFARYKNKRLEAQIDVTRIGDRRLCVLMDGEWWTAGGSANHFTDGQVNGWRQFWRYTKQGMPNGIPIGELKKLTIEELKKLTTER